MEIKTKINKWDLMKLISSTANAKGTSTKWETQEKKRTYKNKPKTINKMVIGTYISIITLNVNELNVNGLNAPTKRQAH